MSAVLTHPEITPQRPHCLAGHVGLELANVILKKPLKCWANSHWITEHFGTRDFSRASCQPTDMLGWAGFAHVELCWTWLDQIEMGARGRIWFLFLALAPRGEKSPLTIVKVASRQVTVLDRQGLTEESCECYQFGQNAPRFSPSQNIHIKKPRRIGNIHYRQHIPTGA